MDIVKHITAHTENLRRGMVDASDEQLRDLKVATLSFFLLLPDFETIVQQHINITVNREQLFDAIASDSLEHYQEAIQASNAGVDVYADDYEELEQLELFVLNAFEYATAGANQSDAVVGLLLEIIDTLDYYENFSDTPLYWNKLLELEVAFQNDILEQIKANGKLRTDSYQERYKEVTFTPC